MVGRAQWFAGLGRGFTVLVTLVVTVVATLLCNCILYEKILTFRLLLYGVFHEHR